MNEHDYYVNCVTKQLSDSNGLYKKAITEFYCNSWNRGNFTLVNLDGFMGGAATDYTWFFTVGDIGEPRISGAASVAGNVVTADIPPKDCDIEETLELWAVDGGVNYLAAQVQIKYIETIICCT